MRVLSKGRVAISCSEFRNIQVGSELPSRQIGSRQTSKVNLTKRMISKLSTKLYSSSLICLYTRQWSSVPNLIAFPSVLLK